MFTSIKMIYIRSINCSIFCYVELFSWNTYCLFFLLFSDMLIPCHKVPVARLFERSMTRQSSTNSNLSKTSSVEHFDDPFAIQNLCFCPYSRLLSVVTSSYVVITFSFSNKENVIEAPVSSINTHSLTLRKVLY